MAGAADARFVKAAVDRVIDGLEQPQELQDEYAAALLDAAQAKASAKIIPQSRMVAAAFAVQDGAIVGPQVGTLAEITMGAEFGSTIYGQFHGRHARGAWLFPTIENPPTSVDAVADRWLEDQIDG